jgi:hypothetical protein
MTFDELNEFKKETCIVFIELYHKNDKPNEDRQRILKYFK